MSIRHHAGMDRSHEDFAEACCRSASVMDGFDAPRRGQSETPPGQPCRTHFFAPRYLSFCKFPLTGKDIGNLAAKRVLGSKLTREPLRFRDAYPEIPLRLRTGIYLPYAGIRLILRASLLVLITYWRLAVRPVDSIWETLYEARKRIIETGLKPAQAGRDLCRAITERRIRVRQILAPPPGSKAPKRILEGSMLYVPVDLLEANLNWRLSRPKDETQIWVNFSPRPFDMTMLQVDRARPYLGWTVDRVEVLVADGKRHFCRSDDAKQVDPPSPRQPATATSEPSAPAKKRGSAKTRALKLAIDTIWRNGEIPNTISAKTRDAQINDWLSLNKHPPVTPKTIRIFLNEPDLPVK